MYVINYIDDFDAQAYACVSSYNPLKYMTLL